MSNQQPHFNLIDEEWIPVVMLDGERRDFSLQGVFDNATLIRSITGELPQMQFVILRLLLAIMYRAYRQEGLSDGQKKQLWFELWNNQSFDDGAISEYLDEFYEGFDLFDEEAPFYQAVGLSYIGKQADPVRTIIPDIPSKDDKLLFSMSDPRRKLNLTFPEAARYLLLAQAFDMAGIKTPVAGNTNVKSGKVYSTGITGWCGTLGGLFCEGNNLFQTLMLNWPLCGAGSSYEGLFGVEDDAPCWETPIETPDQRNGVTPVGPVQALTWQGRRIRLIPDESGSCVNGVVLCYGDAVSPVNRYDCEMMTAWRESKAQQKKLGTPDVPRMPEQHTAHRAFWRSLSAVLAVSGANGSTDDLRPGVIRWLEDLSSDSDIDARIPSIKVHAQGFTYGTQNSVIEDSVDDSFSVQDCMLRHDSEAVRRVVDVIARADAAVKKVVWFVKNVETSAGDCRRYEKFTDGAASAVKESVSTTAYDRLDSLFRNKIAHLSEDTDVFSYCREWCGETERLLLDYAKEYVSQTDARAFRARDGMSPGRALVMLRSQLKTALGLVRETASSGEDGVLDSAEKEGE